MRRTRDRSTCTPASGAPSTATSSMTVRAFGAHEDEGLAEVAVHLTAESMEVLRRRGQVADLHVVLGAELEEPLQPRARVLRPLPLVAVRQEQHDAARPLPLRLGAGDELVDDDLRDVGEVTEL